MAPARQQQRKSKPLLKTATKVTVANKAKPVKSPSTGGKETPQSELQRVQLLLAQIWHRNKNQHRTQKWWKWVGILRRGVRDLAVLEQDEGKDGRADGKAVGEAEKVRKRMERERQRREERRKVEEWVREVVVGKAWL